MQSSPGSDAVVSQSTYEVRIVGGLDDASASRLGASLGTAVAVRGPAGTLITSTLPDQAALIAMLLRLQDLGLKVLELRQVSEAPGPDEGTPLPLRASAVTGG